MSNSNYIKIDNLDEFVNKVEVGDLAQIDSNLRLKIIIPPLSLVGEFILLRISGTNGDTTIAREITQQEITNGEISVLMPVANISDGNGFVQGDYALTLTVANIAGATKNYPGIATFTLDTISTDAPQVALINDSGISNSDFLTSDAAVQVTSSEATSSIEYSDDDGATWSANKPVATEGDNKLLVREVDQAGNASDATTLNFTLDTIAPEIAVNNIISTNDTTPAISGVVNDPNATVVIHIAGIDYPATNLGNGTWQVNDNVIGSLAEGRANARTFYDQLSV